MDFRRLDAEELTKLAEFYVVDVVAIDAASPTKKELLLAIKTADEPITDADYDAFKAAQEKPVDKVEEDVEIEEAIKAQEPVEPVDKSNWVLVKFQGHNPRYDILGYTFQTRHPFQSVEPSAAEYMIKNVPGFRLALPSELAEYYN